MPGPSLRIAMITTHPPGSGSLNEYAFHFVRFLRQKPEVRELILLVDELPPGQTYHFPAALAPVRVVPCWRFGALDNALRIRTALKRTNPDVVLFNIQFATFGAGKIAASFGLAAPALAKLAGYPTIVLLHNIMETIDLRQAGFGGNRLAEAIIRLAGKAATRLLLAADLVAVTIPKYVELLEEKHRAANIVLAPHGSFDETPQPTFDLPPGPLQILTFGKFGTYKRIETLVEAYKLLVASAGPALELVIAGTNSPNAPGYLEGLRQQYAAVPNIRFTGYVAEADVPRLFSEAALVVFPYNSTTGSSGVLHQAGDYGKAVVLPNIGDFAEVISEEGYAGDFFTPDDAQSLAEAINRLLRDPERRRTQGLRNWRAAKGLPIGEVVDWYLLHFQTLLAQRSGEVKPAARNSKLQPR